MSAATQVVFAARNVLRHRARSAMTLGAIAFGVAALIVSGGFVRDLYGQLGEALIRSQSGHLQVAQPSLFAEGSRSPEKHRLAKADALKAELAALPGVRQVSARLTFSGLLSNRRVDVPVLGEGIEPGREQGLMSAITLVAGRALQADEAAGVMVGEGLAAELALRPGDPVVLAASTVGGAMNTADLEVVGVFRSFSRDYDARALKLPLGAAQDLLATPDANAAVVLLERTELTEALAGVVSERVAGRGLAVKTWQELNDFYASTVALFDRQFAVLRFIILCMVALGVANAVNMNVYERLAEFGTMRALGNRGTDVVRTVLLECLLLGALGAALGLLGGVMLAALISAIGIPMPPPPNSNTGFTAAVALDTRLMLESFAVGFVATLLSGLVPALRAARISIVDALRRA